MGFADMPFRLQAPLPCEYVWALVVLSYPASGPKSARVYCGCRPGPTRVTPPSKQDDGNVRAPSLARAVCVAVQVVAVVLLSK